MRTVVDATKVKQLLRQPFCLYLSVRPVLSSLQCFTKGGTFLLILGGVRKLSKMYINSKLISQHCINFCEVNQTELFILDNCFKHKLEYGCMSRPFTLC